MFLKSMQVYDNWQARALLNQADDRARWRGAVFAVVVSLALVLLVKAIPLQFGSTPLLAGGAASALYLLLGVAAIARVPPSHRYLFAPVYLLIVFGVLLSDLAMQQALASEIKSQWIRFLYLGVIAFTLLVPGWSLLGWVFFKNRRDMTQGLGLVWWLTQVLYGLGAGGLVALLVFLADSFSGVAMPLSLPRLPLLFQHAIYAIGLRAPGEEIFFRGIVYQYLYRRLGKGFWTATLITLPLNLAIYIVQIPRLGSPPLVALALIGPGLMAIASTALYARRGSLVASMINNALFQVFAFALGVL
jgi:membrane protease YdiL (CAAX protease family)